MRTKGLLSVALVMFMACPAVARAQSLADVARAEEARRKKVGAPSKVYTNEDLKPGGAGSAPVPAPTPPIPASTGPKTTDAPASAAPKPADEGVKDEKYWKSRITAIREAITRNKVLLDALQSRVNALSTDFVNASDPVQRAVIEDNRKIALAEMNRLTIDSDKQNKALIDIEEEARKASVPPGWLR